MALVYLFKDAAHLLIKIFGREGKYLFLKLVHFLV